MVSLTRFMCYDRSVYLIDSIVSARLSVAESFILVMTSIKYCLFGASTKFIKN